MKGSPAQGATIKNNKSKQMTVEWVQRGKSMSKILEPGEELLLPEGITGLSMTTVGYTPPDTVEQDSHADAAPEPKKGFSGNV